MGSTNTIPEVTRCGLASHGTVWYPRLPTGLWIVREVVTAERPTDWVRVMVHIYMYMHKHVCKHMYIWHVPASICISVYVHKNACMHVHMYACSYQCANVLECSRHVGIMHVQMPYILM